MAIITPSPISGQALAPRFLTFLMIAKPMKRTNAIAKATGLELGLVRPSVTEKFTMTATIAAP